MAEDDKKPKDTIGHAILEQARKSAPFQARKISPDDAIPEVFGKNKNKNFELNKPDREWKSYDGRPLDQDRVKRAKLLMQAVGWEDNFTHLKRDDVNAIIRNCVEIIWNDEEDRGLYRTHKLVRIDREPKKDAPTLSSDLYRDEPHENLENPFEPPPLRGVDEKESLTLEDIDNLTLAAHVLQREALDPAFAGMLRVGRTVKHAFGKAANPAMPLPTVAPKLWADNTEGLPATAFVAKYYAPWIEAGVLTRKSIEDCDPPLANAYSKRKSAFPDEAIPLAKAVHPRTIADPQEAGEHYRAKGRERTARYRNRDKLAHDPN